MSDEMSTWDKIKRGFQILADDPGRIGDTASGQLDRTGQAIGDAGQAIGEVLVPDGGEAARELARVMGLAWDELSDMEKQKLVAEALRNGQ